MKINDKSLSLYAVSRQSINKEGYLEKKGEINHGYKKRWFVLKGNLLFYFEKKSDKQPVGMIILENCSVEVNDGDRYSFCIRYQAFGTTGASRTYILCADSETEMEQWIKSITSASYCYAEMLVKEYEKQLAIERLKSQPSCDNVSHNYKRATVLQLANKNLVTADKDVTDSSRTSSTSTRKSENRSPNSRIVHSSNAMNATLNYTKSKFGTLNVLRRSKSSENVNKIIPLSNKSPYPKRKTVKSGSNYAVANRNEIAYETEKTTFETLHTSFGAAVWTKIGNTL